MSSFDEREKSFEKKFAKDQELQFKVQARSNKYIAEFGNTSCVSCKGSIFERGDD